MQGLGKVQALFTCLIKMQSILKREAARYYKTHVKQNRALGELDHPNPTSEHFRQLCTESVSHRVREITPERC